MRSLVLLAVCTALAAASAGDAAARKPCLAPEEMAAVISTIAPSGVTAVARQCRSTLPTDAYLTRSATSLAQRLRPGALAALPAARGALGRIAGMPLPAMLSDSAVMSLIDAGLTDQIIGKLKPEECAAIDRALRQLDPLPAGNVATLIAALAELGMDDDAEFAVCRATL